MDYARTQTDRWIESLSLRIINTEGGPWHIFIIRSPAEGFVNGVATLSQGWKYTSLEHIARHTDAALLYTTMDSDAKQRTVQSAPVGSKTVTIIHSV